MSVAPIQHPNGVIEGRRAKCYDYTGQILVSVKEYDELIQKEIRRVKSMKTQQVPHLGSMMIALKMVHIRRGAVLVLFPVLGGEVQLHKKNW